MKANSVYPARLDFEVGQELFIQGNKVCYCGNIFYVLSIVHIIYNIFKIQHV